MEKTVIVTREFRDRESFGIVHSVGDTMTVDEGRAKELIALGLVEERTVEVGKALFEDVVVTPVPTPKRRRKTS